MAIASTSIYQAQVSVDVRRHDSTRTASRPLLTVRANPDGLSTGTDLSLELAEARKLYADLGKGIAEAEEIARTIAAERAAKQEPVAA